MEIKIEETTEQVKYTKVEGYYPAPFPRYSDYNDYEAYKAANQAHAKTRVPAIMGECEYTRILVTCDHGLVDEKGRTIGGIGYVSKRSIEEKWAMYTHPTRNGKHFGASHATKYFDTKEAAIEAVKKNLTAQGKRYAKKYAQTA